jgi:hypothetical protein
MKIHLSKPGGQVEGPLTLEEINRDLAERRYHENDYWAWYDGLTEWVPLHSVPGIVSAGPQAATRAPVSPEPACTDGGTQLLTRAEPEPEAAAAPEPAAPEAQAAAPPSLPQQLFSGMPFEALEQIFILTSGEGPAASHSAATAGMLEATTGELLDKIRQTVPRHVLASCEFLLQSKGGAASPDAALRAVTKLNPDLVRLAREGRYRVCLRTFPVESGDMVGLFLFYKK